MEFVYLSKEIVKDNIRNLSQLTFEVTDACNLQCKYCGYGDLYNGYDFRNNKLMSTEIAFRVLDFMYSHWSLSDSYNKKTYISFYGGEPLLNMQLVQSVVHRIREQKIQQCDFVFAMTTNGVLLDRYIDYLCEYDFHLLISLDGNEINNAYRVDHSGRSSFKKVYDNIKLIREKYPIYYEKNINFNSVLHDLNNYQDVITFFQDEFSKVPTLSELSSNGIKDGKRSEYLAMRNDKRISLNKVVDKEKLKNLLFMDYPDTAVLCTYLHAHSGNVYQNYIDLIIDQNVKRWYPTGTCLPFGKKMFVTVNGKILPCERINQDYSLGYVDSEKVQLDIDMIVNIYNDFYKKYIPQCLKCYNNNTCKQCMFNNSDLKGSARCDAFMNRQLFDEYQEDQYKYLSENPTLYKKIMTEVIIH